MIIKFFSLSDRPLGVLREFSSFVCDKNLSGKGALQVSLPLRQIIGNESILQMGCKVLVEYAKGVSVFTIRSGILTDININDSSISLTCSDYQSWIENRLLREDLTYTLTSVSTIVSGLYSSLSFTYPLPFVIGKNNISDTVNVKFFQGESLYDCLRKLKDIVGDWRIGQTLDYSYKVGETKQGLYTYNYLDRQASNIISRDYNLSLADLYNGSISNDGSSIEVATDNASVSEFGLLERFGFNPSGHNTKTQGDGIQYPTVVADSSKDTRRDMQVGDEKRVRLRTELELVRFDFATTVQSVTIQAGGGKYNVDVVLSTKSIEPKEISIIFEKINKKIKNLEVTQ